MARNITKKPTFYLDEAKKNEIWGIFFLAISIFLFISLMSFDMNDIRLYTSTPNEHIHNFAGLIGAYLGWALFFLIGLSSYAIPIVVLFWAMGRFLGAKPQKVYVKFIGTLILMISVSTLLSLLFFSNTTVRFQRGGITGLIVSDILMKYFGRAGSFVIDATLLLLSLLLATEFLIFPLVLAAYSWVKRIIWGAAAGEPIARKTAELPSPAARTTAAAKVVKPPQPVVDQSLQQKAAARQEQERTDAKEAARIKIEKPKVPTPVKAPVK
ncbi:MAG: DNA translocase FtsK 4TM domain-containing protein, partial [Candidatus Omnitrophota bacterium]